MSCSLSTGLFAQSRNLDSLFFQLIEEAKVYEDVNLYGDCLEKLTDALNFARISENREQEIEVMIKIAELLRKSDDFERGLEMLRSLNDSHKYPKLHVQKLSRLAALYNQGMILSDEEKKDSLFFYLNQGISYAEKYNMPIEEAAMRNELGFIQGRVNMQDQGMINLLKAKELFKANKDPHNEAWVMANILEILLGRGDFHKADSLSEVLVEHIEGTQWHAVKSRIYAIIANRNSKDTVAHSYWMGLANGETVEHVRQNSYDQMSSFQTIYDTEKYQKEARENARFNKEKTLELTLQRTRSNGLIIVILVLILIAIAFFIWVSRERQLKRRLSETMEEVGVLNERYHMLIVESNHRIKNNLQMIISMLKYSSKGLNDSNQNALNRMAGKISTISALHKHLYADVHNEFVSMNTYFSEIVKLYNVILSSDFEVVIDIDDVKLRSERIIYFGLIFNEMLSNTIEHNTSDDKVISIQVKPVSEGFKYYYCDGSAHEKDVKKGTGLELIGELVSRVKGSKYSFDPKSGAYSFIFNRE